MLFVELIPDLVVKYSGIQILQDCLKYVVARVLPS